MKQMTFAGAKGFAGHGRATRKAEFLARMDALVPWAEFCALIEPHYPRAGNGRPPLGVERMLRMYLLANWFNLSDEACEDALYGRPVERRSLGREIGGFVRHRRKIVYLAMPHSSVGHEGHEERRRSRRTAENK